MKIVRYCKVKHITHGSNKSDGWDSSNLRSSSGQGLIEPATTTSLTGVRMMTFHFCGGFTFLAP